MPFVNESVPLMPTEDRKHAQFADKPAINYNMARKNARGPSIKYGKAAQTKPRKSYYKPIAQSTRYLSLEQKLDVVRRLAAGENPIAIAKSIGKTKSTVYQIKSGKTQIGTAKRGRRK